MNAGPGSRDARAHGDRAGTTQRDKEPMHQFTTRQLVAIVASAGLGGAFTLALAAMWFI